MLELFIIALATYGLGGWLPGTGFGRSWLGVRALCGFALFLIALTLLNLVAGAGLSNTSRILAVLGLIGVVRLIWRERPGPADALHPIIVLPAVCLAAMILRGFAYEPLAWDELSSWLYLARHITRVDSLVAPGLESLYGAGWLVALALPSLLTGGFTPEKAAVVPLVLHIALLGLAFDVFTALVRRRGLPAGAALVTGWLLLLLWLAVEATWRLAPTNLLIEKPQIYFLSGCLLLALAVSEVPCRWRAASLQFGLLLAAGYLIKVSMLAFIGPAALLWAWMGWRLVGADRGEMVTGLVLALAPFIVVYFLWRYVGAGPAESCLADPLLMVAEGLRGGETLSRATDLASRLFGWIANYLGHFKLPLTVLSLAGFAAMFVVPEHRPIAVVFLLYLIAYFGALYIYHLFCFGDYYFEVLNSPDRFTRVPLRVLHALGLFELTLLGASRIARIQHGGTLMAAVTGGAIAALAGWQAWQIDRSLRAMATRFDATPEQVDTMRLMQAEAELIARVASDPDKGREVLLLVQGSDGYHYVVVWFFADGRYRLWPQFSWGETPLNPWMIPVTPEAMRSRALAASIVWPVRMDPWLVETLAPITDDPRCLEDRHAYLMPEGGILRCRPKPAN